MKRNGSILLSLIFLLGTSAAFALDGEVISVNGKVESLAASGEWKAMKKGDPVTAGTVISTGFKSEATVKLGESILTIKPLTRMTLNELVEKEDIVNTDIYLEVGNVKAEVKSLNNKKNGFKVKSPVATASVRGTIFELGDDLIITQGAVLLTSPLGQQRVGQAGQELVVIGDSVASPAVALRETLNKIPLSTTPSTQATSTIQATAAATEAPTPEATAADPIVKPTTVVFTVD